MFLFYSNGSVTIWLKTGLKVESCLRHKIFSTSDQSTQPSVEQLIDDMESWSDLIRK